MYLINLDQKLLIIVFLCHILHIIYNVVSILGIICILIINFFSILISLSKLLCFRLGRAREITEWTKKFLKELLNVLKNVSDLMIYNINDQLCLQASLIYNSWIGLYKPLEVYFLQSAGGHGIKHYIDQLKKLQ